MDYKTTCRGKGKGIRSQPNYVSVPKYSMDPNLYRAAMEGKADILLQKKDQLVLQVTPNKNSVLHIAAMSGSIDCVHAILRTCPALLRKVNYKGETPLHIAAKEGNLDIVGALVECARGAPPNEELESGVVAAEEMLRMTDDDGDTALHHAVRGGKLGVVKRLIEEDAEFSHPLNKAEETPLYLAAEKRLEECVSEILITCTSPSPGGPGGRTALHAAAIFNSKGIMTQLLEWNQGLAKKSDEYGWTPLHYAARLGYIERVKQLLDLDPSLAYLTADKDDKKTALHIAVSRGHIKIMKHLISTCPDCSEMINSKGRNIIHIAVENRQVKVIKFILEQSFLHNLINQKDDNGNTPLHLLAASAFELPGTDLLRHPKVEHMVFNKEKMTPLEAYSNNTLDFQAGRNAFKKFGAIGHRNLISSDMDEIASKDKFRTEWREKGVEQLTNAVDKRLIIGGILITTVTFAAGFTLPGGYESNAGPNQGMAVLARKAAFKSFLIFDTIAMLCSSCAVFIYILVQFYKDIRMIARHQRVANMLMLCGEGAMILAFITGIYAVLGNSEALAISICVIGCFFFPFSFFELKSIDSYFRTSHF